MFPHPLESDEQPHALSHVSKVVQAKVQLLLFDLLRDCSDVRAAMVGSTDGMAWAHTFQHDPSMDPARFAAMSSSILALGDNIVQEIRNGLIKNVILESEGGNILVMHAGTRLLLTVFAKKNANLGLSLAHAKKTAEEIQGLSMDR